MKGTNRKGKPLYVPTTAEHTAITKGRAEIKRGESVTIDELKELAAARLQKRRKCKHLRISFASHRPHQTLPAVTWEQLLDGLEIERRATVLGQLPGRREWRSVRWFVRKSFDSARCRRDRAERRLRACPPLHAGFRRPAGIAVALSMILLGAAIELLRPPSPGRTPDIADTIANSIGVLSGIASGILLTPLTT